VGTSERGSIQSACELQLPPHQHLLVAFGGPQGLEDCLNRDTQKPAADVRELFDVWVNTCPGQGSRTIRTEEALLISLAYLQPSLKANLAGSC
jgi:predicted SPOUT superfamily RNA methylase MTH1